MQSMPVTIVELDSQLFWLCLADESITGVLIPPGFGQDGGERLIAVNCSRVEGAKLRGFARCAGFGIYAVCLNCLECGARVYGVARR